MSLLAFETQDEVGYRSAYLSVVGPGDYRGREQEQGRGSGLRQVVTYRV